MTVRKALFGQSGGCVIMRNYFLSEYYYRRDLIISIISLLVFILLFVNFRFEDTFYISPIRNIMTNTDIVFIALKRLTIGFAGCLLVISFFRVAFYKSNNSLITRLGEQTIGVYLMQSAVIEILFNLCPITETNHLVRDLLIVPIISIVIYVLLGYIQILLSKNIYFARLLFGNYNVRG